MLLFEYIITSDYCTLHSSLFSTAAATTKCRFPTWLTQYQHWHSLDYTRSYTFHHRNTTLRIANMTAGSIPNDGPGVQQQLSALDPDQDVRVICTEIKMSNSEMAYLITHYTMGW